MTNKPAPVASSPVTLNLPDEATLVDRVTNDQTASVANPRLMTIWLKRNSGWMLKSNVLPNARKTWSSASASINAGAKASGALRTSAARYAPPAANTTSPA